MTSFLFVMSEVIYELFSLSLSLPFRLSLTLSLSLSACLPACLSVCLSVSPLPLSPSHVLITYHHNDFINTLSAPSGLLVFGLFVLSLLCCFCCCCCCCLHVYNLVLPSSLCLCLSVSVCLSVCLSVSLMCLPPK